MKSTSVLFVCMGNICRSPTAEGVLRRKLEAVGLAPWVDVDSAGTHGHYHQGEPPDARSRSHAMKRGYDLSGHRARPVAEADFECFDLLLAMDEDNLEWLQQACPAGLRHKLQLLLAFAPAAGTRVVPDPYYGNAAGFDAVLDLVESACDGLMLHLAERCGQPSGTS